AVPGLAGFVGIDLVRQPDGRLCVIEINPRLTCAYAGLVGAALERTDERSRARRSPSPCSPTGRTQTSHLRNLAAAIIAAHDGTLATHAIDTADATPEPS
ncbi:MAG: ATP-grasp domain-containing protein, partial [Thauera sp.]|nr:ATP-grasp domain-containing protein [Thauera sp.]